MIRRRAMCVLTCAAALLGQSDSRPRFEVDSVKLSPPGSRTRWSFPPGEVLLTHTRLQDTVPLAYGLQPFLVSGGPAWFATDFYDIVGKLAVQEGSPPEKERALQALQVLLEDRFRLRFHREPKSMPLYKLTVAKTGSKFKDGEDLPENTPPGFEGRTASRIVRRKMPLASLVAALAAYLQTPVDDETRLAGLYSFVLEWHHDDPADSDPAMIAALRSQLGLDVEKAKGPVSVLIIDSAERPAAN